jgi:hypothetical protein
MMRKFKFEAEVYESLNCLPMAARRKLDSLGIKLHLAQWEQLGRGERLMVCHAPVDSEEEQCVLRTFIEEAALSRTGSPAKILPDDARQSANPPNHPPPALTRHARACGVELDNRAWAALDDDQRYALIKLGDAEEPSHNLALALQEFFESGPRAAAS